MHHLIHPALQNNFQTNPRLALHVQAVQLDCIMWLKPVSTCQFSMPKGSVFSLEHMMKDHLRNMLTQAHTFSKIRNTRALDQLRRCSNVTSMTLTWGFYALDIDCVHAAEESFMADYNPLPSRQEMLSLPFLPHLRTLSLKPVYEHLSMWRYDLESVHALVQACHNLGTIALPTDFSLDRPPAVSTVELTEGEHLESGSTFLPAVASRLERLVISTPDALLTLSEFAKTGKASILPAVRTLKMPVAVRIYDYVLPSARQAMTRAIWRPLLDLMPNCTHLILEVQDPDDFRQMDMLCDALKASDMAQSLKQNHIVIDRNRTMGTRGLAGFVYIPCEIFRPFCDSSAFPRLNALKIENPMSSIQHLRRLCTVYELDMIEDHDDYAVNFALIRDFASLSSSTKAHVEMRILPISEEGLWNTIHYLNGRDNAVEVQHRNSGQERKKLLQMYVEQDAWWPLAVVRHARFGRLDV